MAYKFIISTEPETEGEVMYLAVSEENIESRPLADCYDRYGKEVGHSDAGDYFQLHTQEACDAANIAWNDDLEPGDEDFVVKFVLSDYTIVSAYEHGGPFDALLEKFGENSEHATLEQETVECITYHDGHNFRTAYLGGENPDYNIVDHELEAELQAALDSKSWLGENHGVDSYTAEGWNIYQSRWQGDFEAYYLTRASVEEEQD